MVNWWLTFSDSAKYAEAAKNISLGLGSYIHHSFFEINLLHQTTFPAAYSPVTVYFLAAIFKVFPANDHTIILIGNLILYIAASVLFLLVRRLHSLKAAIVSIFFFLLNPYLWTYAHNFTTEIVFILFLVIFLLLYYLPGKKRLLSLIPLILLLGIRQQAVIFIGTVIFTEFIYSRQKKSFFILSGIILFLLLIFFKAFPNSPVSPFNAFGSTLIASGVSQGNYLRGQPLVPLSAGQLFSKTFYNLYNFVKAPERIAGTSLFIFSFLGFLLTKSKKIFVLTFTSLILFILAASLTLPNARYIHPLLPLIFICASIGLVEISQKLPKYKLAFLIFVIFLLHLPAIGKLTLDRRFLSQQFNLNKPPVYKVISDVMAQNIPQNQLIITNLDAWAAWYHGLSTMWFPLQPEMLSVNPPPYIVITNYLENDADFALGPWREVVYSPHQIQDEFLNKNYSVLSTFVIKPDQVYEKQQYLGTILMRKP